MVVIFVFFALFLAIHFLSKQFKRPGTAHLFQLVACFVLLFGFFGFRDITVLNDTPHYYGYYYQLSKIKSYLDSSVFTFRILLSLEYGYQVLMHILIKYVSKEPFSIIILSSFIITWGNIHFWNKHTKNIALAILMVLLSGVYFDQYCLIRQTFALLFFYKAYEYLQRDEWKPYVLLILCASLFHLSSLVLLILPILQRISINVKNVSIILIIAVFISLSIYQIFNMFGMAGSMYYEMNQKRDTLPIAAILDSALMFLLVGMCIFMHKQMGFKQINKTNFWISVLGLAICLITPSFISFFRLNVYVWPIIYLTFFKLTDTYVSYCSKGAQRECYTLRETLLSSTIVLLAIRMAIILTYKNEWYHLIPYSFYDFSDKFHYFNIYWKQ